VDASDSTVGPDGRHRVTPANDRSVAIPIASFDLVRRQKGSSVLGVWTLVDHA
jgi:hypothetical protein